MRVPNCDIVRFINDDCCDRSKEVLYAGVSLSGHFYCSAYKGLLKEGGSTRWQQFLSRGESCRWKMISSEELRDGKSNSLQGNWYGL